jgi:hypothetical protein
LSAVPSVAQLRKLQMPSGRAARRLWLHGKIIFLLSPVIRNSPRAPVLSDGRHGAAIPEKHGCPGLDA